MKRIVVLFTIIVVIFSMTACDPSSVTQEQIIQRVSDKPYEQLITKSYTSKQFSDFFNILRLSEDEQRKLYENSTANFLYMNLFQNLESLNKKFPVECIRDVTEANAPNAEYYAIYEVDGCLLYILFGTNPNGSIVTCKHYEEIFALPKKTTLTDDKVLLIKETDTYADVLKIDNSTGIGRDPAYTFAFLAQNKNPDRSFESCLVSWSDDNFQYYSYDISTLYYSIHYTTENNWYRINYIVKSDNVDSFEAQYGKLTPKNIQNFLTVHSVEQIDPMPILEQDLPK